MNDQAPLQASTEETMTVTPEALLGQIVSYIGEEFVVIPTSGWQAIVKSLHEYKDDSGGTIIEILEKLKIPVIPISLSPKEEESRIILPNDTPKNGSNIIV